MRRNAEDDPVGITTGDNEKKVVGNPTGDASKMDAMQSDHHNEAHTEKEQQQRLLRAVLCTRIKLPAEEDLSSALLLSVLRGDARELLEAMKRREQWGPEIALVSDSRHQTALHLAVGTKNLELVEALLEWRGYLCLALENDMRALDQRRDERVDGLRRRVSRRPRRGDQVLQEIERFQEWLLVERRRIKWTYERHHQEAWLRAVTAMDNRGRTPIHWAASDPRADGSILSAILVAKRGRFPVQQKRKHSDLAVFRSLGKLVNTKSTRHQSLGVGEIGKSTRSNGCFALRQAFDRRAGEARRVTQDKREPETERGVHADGCKAGRVGMADPGRRVVGGRARVERFCGDLAVAVTKLSANEGSRGETYLYAMFRAFDRAGHGTLSREDFRKALVEMDMEIDELTLSDLVQHFGAPAGESSLRGFDAKSNGGGDETQEKIALSYALLVDVVFGKKEAEIDDRLQSQSKEDRVHDKATASDSETGPKGRRRFVGSRQIERAGIAAIDARDALGRTPLFIASAIGAVPVAKLLLRHGASPACMVKETRLTAIAVALNPVMKRILTSAAQASISRSASRRGNYAAATDVSIGTTEADELITALIEAEMRSPVGVALSRDKKTGLHLAASAGLADPVENIIHRDKSAGEGFSLGGRPGRHRSGWLIHGAWTDPRRLASRQGPHRSFASGTSGVDAFGPIIKIPSFLKTDASGWSPLHACCAGFTPGHYRCAVALLRLGCDPNVRTNAGRTPLHVAANASAKANEEGKETEEEGGELRDEDRLISLLVSHGGALEAEDGQGLRPTHVAAKGGHCGTLHALLAAGADLHATTPRKWNLLHYAAAAGHVNVIHLLVYWDADTGLLTKQSNSAEATPIDLARTASARRALSSVWESAARGDPDEVSRLCFDDAQSLRPFRSRAPWLQHGVDKTSQGLEFTALHACMAGLAAVAKGLDVSPRHNPSLPRKDGHHPRARLSLYAHLVREMTTGIEGTARHHRRKDRTTDGRSHGIADADHISVCCILLSSGARVDAQDALCRTPLTLASATGNLKAVEILLAAGADPRSADSDGNTPVHFALAYANAAVAAVLAKAGADLQARNGKGLNPQAVAGSRNNLTAVTAHEVVDAGLASNEDN